jgi:hypothetical protein
MASASEYNTQIRDNFNFLLSGFAMDYLVYEPTADYTTTSSTFGDVDATNLILTMTVKGGRALVWASFDLKADNTASSSAEATILCDTATYPDDSSTNGLVRVAQNVGMWASIIGYWSGLTDASHTFKLQFRNVTSGATATIGKVNTGSTRGGPVTMFGMAW